MTINYICTDEFNLNIHILGNQQRLLRVRETMKNNKFLRLRPPHLSLATRPLKKPLHV